MTTTPIRTAALAFLLPLLAGCQPGGDEARLASLEATVSGLEASLGTTQASLDAQRAEAQAAQDALLARLDAPVAFATASGEADTLDGLHANEVAEVGYFTPVMRPGAAEGWQPVGSFAYVRAGRKVRVTGTLSYRGVPLDLVQPVWIDGLPYRQATSGPGVAVETGSCAATLSFQRVDIPVTCRVRPEPMPPSIFLQFTTQEPATRYEQGSLSLDILYEAE